ncbi:MAG: bifunctional 4-hydroxy-2-oxoglutarate aldolase/2-dehydro-3-deoxy-phosphogluconate aldolase [Anaerolineae bacterium]
MNEIVKRIGEMGIVPVVALDDADTAAPLGQALLAGGLPTAELTFRTDAAAESIGKMCHAHPEMLVGAGTVLTVNQAEQAVSAGAKYLLAPGLDPEIVEWCLSKNVLIIPGVMSPTDVTLAVKMGLKLLKFFPAAAAGGSTFLKSMSDPFVGIDFMPTGGINAKNLPEFLAMPMVQACGGSWLVKKQLISDGNFAEITRLTKEAVAIVKRARQG